MALDPLAEMLGGVDVGRDSVEEKARASLYDHLMDFVKARFAKGVLSQNQIKAFRRLDFITNVVRPRYSPPPVHPGEKASSKKLAEYEAKLSYYNRFSEFLDRELQRSVSKDGRGREDMVRVLRGESEPEPSRGLLERFKGVVGRKPPEAQE